jgi:NIMA (never in mitosis gene a)-related kinase
MVQGGDLDKLLKQLKQNGKTLDESLVLDWFVQLTNAVRYIHDRKILHRDLKTRNIFIKDNNIKLGDFGISRILAGTSDYATTFTGTPYYMSPEVLKHDRYNTKSDIWSLGAVLYELCTSEHAYDGSVSKNELNLIAELMIELDGCHV